jgi:hypothetical protein
MGMMGKGMMGKDVNNGGVTHGRTGTIKRRILRNRIPYSPH